jgi:hypothetical protein
VCNGLDVNVHSKIAIETKSRLRKKTRYNANFQENINEHRFPLYFDRRMTQSAQGRGSICMKIRITYVPQNTLQPCQKVP